MLATGFVAVALLIVALYAIVRALSHTPRVAAASECKFVTNIAGADTGVPSAPQALPSIKDKATIDISVVIPCYNERERLPLMLDEAVPYLEKTYASWEIVLVDDGSRDETGRIALSWAAAHKLEPGQLRLSTLERNRGKGGAVSHGVMHSRGNLVLFADADGATKFSDLKKLEEALFLFSEKNKPAVAIGSRAHMVNTDVVVKRTLLRNFLMYGLHALVFIFGLRHIGDTQCGFKLFTRAACAEIFPNMRTERWIFDVEILIRAARLRINVVEVPVSWHEVQGSKVDLARDSILMAIDLVVMRFAFLFHIYKDLDVKLQARHM